MTAPFLNFLEDPTFQEAILKIERMSPDQRAILNSLLTETAGDYAEAEIKRQIALMELGSKEKAEERALNLRERKIQSDYELGKRELDITGALRERGLTQRGELERGKMVTQAGIRKRGIESAYRLREAELDFEKRQRPWTIGIGLADVGTGALTGYYRMKRDLASADELRKLRRKLLALEGY